MHPVVDRYNVSAVLSELKLPRLELARTLGSPIWFGCVFSPSLMFHHSESFLSQYEVSLFCSVCSVQSVLPLWSSSCLLKAVPMSVCMCVTSPVHPPNVFGYLDFIWVLSEVVFLVSCVYSLLS